MQSSHALGRRCFPFNSHENTANISCPHAVKSTCVHTVTAVQWLQYTVQVYSIIDSQGWNY